METSDVIVPGVGDGRGWISLGAGHHHQPAVSLQVHVHAGPIAARTVMAVTRHADINQSLIEGPQGIVIEPQPAHNSCAKIFYDDVSHNGQAESQLFPGFTFEIYGYCALASIGVQIRGMTPLTIHEGRLPGMVRMLAALYPDDVGPKVGEQAGAEGSGQHVGEVEDPDSSQRSRCSIVHIAIQAVILS